MTTGTSGPRPRPGLHHKVAFTIVGAAVLFLVMLLPFALGSVLTELVQPPRFTSFSITPAGTAPTPPYVRLLFNVVSLDQWGGTVTLHVSGTHVCALACAASDRGWVVPIPAAQDAVAPLPSDVITLPPTAREVSEDIKLPVSGDAVRYPFDSYRVDFGLIGERVSPDGTVQGITATDAQGHFIATLATHVPLTRTRLSKRLSVQDLPPNPDGYQYLAGARLVLTRPLYIQLLTVLIVGLIAAASAFAVFLRPIRDLVLSTGGLILGVWGVRSILLGPGVSGLSAVDFALSLVILFFLLAIAFRGVSHLETLAGYPLRQRLGHVPAVAEEEAEECNGPIDP